DGCAEALPVPVENERGECRRERLYGEEGADEEGDGGVQRARFGGSRGQAGSPAIGGPAGHQHPFELCCESGGERDAERKRELGAHSLRYRREQRSPGEWLERERVLGEPRPLVRVTRGHDDPLTHRPAAHWIEALGPVEGERLLPVPLVGQLEDHRSLPEAG